MTMSLHQDPEIAEQLSAFIDGELDVERSRFLIRRLGTDAELMAAWERLHLARACMKRDDVALARRDLAADIAAAVAAESVPQRRAPIAARIGQWAAGAAVAASVAMVALIAVQPGAPQVSESLATVPVPAATPPVEPQVAPSQWRERDLRPSLAAQTASAARLSGSGTAPGPVVAAQPLYVAPYLVPQASRDAGFALRRDGQGNGWVMVEAVKAESKDPESAH
jgi:negative regulator of sigma E activity